MFYNLQKKGVQNLYKLLKKCFCSIIGILLLFSNNVCLAKSTCKNQIVSKFTLKDSYGKKYTVDFTALSATKKVAGNNDVWVGASKGEIIYEGNFKLSVEGKNNKQSAIKPYLINNYTYNLSRKMVYVLPSKIIGQPDIILVSECMCSNYDQAQIFYINNNKLNRLAINLDNSSEKINYYLGYSFRPKNAERNMIQIAGYSNADGRYFFDTYYIDFKNAKVSMGGSKAYFPSSTIKGSDVLKMWLSNPSYVVK